MGAPDLEHAGHPGVACLRRCDELIEPPLGDLGDRGEEVQRREAHLGIGVNRDLAHVQEGDASAARRRDLERDLERSARGRGEVGRDEDVAKHRALEDLAISTPWACLFL
jgi:hypothetical protein